ncbi:HAMP domain-containing protein [Nitrosarchaeum sp. AC2]|uniref:HAMP domain-containing protein n=1 Tax=Nitrosarchaeum sp. AC2 TaxID=2259673 RepID=UPI0015CEEB0E|nr:HAMP domain-containing protein [Nitrosarchaeum sp. AC2]QLH11728.1 adenylate/guanylate cyclase domain-containing protein [Nitrosarchaeum sp. AC2]
MQISFSIDKKLIFLVIIVSIITLLVTAYLSFNYAEQILIERASDLLLGESATRGNAIRLLFESRIDQNQILANDPMIKILVNDLNQVSEDDLHKEREIKRRDFLTQIQAFQTLVGFSIGFEDVKIIGANGNVYFSLGKLTDNNFLQDPLFQKGLKKPIVDFEPTATGKKMIIVSPIFALDDKKNDEPIGVVISRMRTESLDNILTDSSGLGKTGEVYIVSDGFLMLSESRFIENAIFKQKVDTVPVQKCFRESEDFSGIYLDYRKINIYGSSYCANDLGFVLLAEIDESETIQPVIILQNRIFQTGLVITIIMTIVAFLISKSMSRPLIKLKNAANKVASGDFNVRTNITTKDEIGELSQAFDLMTEKLQKSLIEIKEKEDVIKQQEDILLQFSDHSEQYCVCMVDIMNSTKITLNLSESQTSEFYKIFLNSIASTVRNFGGIVIKNIGDALLFYFPVIHSEEESTLKKCLDCCLALGELHDDIVKKLENHKLPIFDYRTSSTYGIVRIAKTSTSSINDIFGNTVNRCAKINRLAPANGLVIGEEFYKSAKNFDDYIFKKIENTFSSSESDYPVYRVSRKNR